MYKRTSQGWVKHLDFILLDALLLQLSFILAHTLRHGISLPYANESYRNLAFFIAVWDFLVSIVFNTLHNVLKRGYLLELGAMIQQGLLDLAGVTILLFSLHVSGDFSRLVVYYTLIFYVLLGYAGRLLWKQWLRRKGNTEDEDHPKETMIVVTAPDNAEGIIARLTSNPLDSYTITGIVLTQPSEITQVQGINVVCPLEEAAHYICREWVDTVYIDGSLTDPGVLKLQKDCQQMAVPVHQHIPGMTQEGFKQYAEKIGGTTVLTTSINYATPGELLLKRILDIVGSLVGSFLALLIMLIVGPIIKLASPGPILFKQERIGLNGKHFMIYKLRSMYMDAEARKQELWKDSRGAMFKLDFDPRIIGNEILPDGTRKTGIGEFIRRTSLDEFPQFFNVLKGEMSLVGTRPPTVDEWEKYEFHHRARLSCKPGITGMWQVSGRSEITDFEEVVKLDTSYISNWSLGLDLKIILKTIGVVVRHKGAM